MEGSPGPQDPELWEAHDLVVVNPDGFQGDERDVIFYSLPFDNSGMTRAALSSRQSRDEHVQAAVYDNRPLRSHRLLR